MNQPPRAQLLINADGSIGVQGPINDKVLCFGLLGCAHDAIKDFADKQAAASRIVPVQATDPMLINPRRNGGARGD